MNDKFTNDIHDDEFIARKLNQVAEETHVNSQFAAELEERLRSAHQPKKGWFTAFSQISPTLRWVAVMILLALILSWSIKSLVPAPQPAINATPINRNQVTATPTVDGTQGTTTPAPQKEGGVDFRGAKLYMNAKLPDSPGQANLYQVSQPQPATADYAQSLAQQLGITGDVYLTQGQNPNTTALMVTDGKQQLVVYGENNYTYTSDLVTAARNYNGFKNDNAEAIIREFLQTHGFNANFKLVDSGTLGGYILHQLTPDGLPVAYDDMSNSVRITLNENGEILNMTAVMVNYDAAGLGSFGIISVDEALQLFLNDNISGGKLENSYGSTDQQYVPPQIWYHDYPDNEPVTIYGNMSSSKAADADKPAIIFIDTIQAIGNIDGLDTLDYYTFIEATGQFVVENGVRKFNVETWSKDVQNASIFGGARREGDQIIVNDQNGGNNTDYVLVDPPADLPSEVNFPDSAVTVNGAVVDGKLHWTMIDYYADSKNMGGGGGGGGGGLGLYPLNLSGTPVPFPTPIPAGGYSPQELAGFLKYMVKEGDTLSSIASAHNITVDDIIRANQYLNTNIQVGWVITLPGIPGPTRLDGARGTVQVQIYEKPNGTRRAQYNFFGETEGEYYQLTGDNLEPLQNYNNYPVKIWGTISYDKTGTALLNLEKFEALYPDLHFETLTGTQQDTEISGNKLVLFTSEGTTYIQMSSSGGYPDHSVYDGVTEVILEVLRVPNETYEGYPAVRVIRSAPAVDPTTGKKMKLPPVSDQPDIFPDPFGNADARVLPDITIESVELVYVTSNPAYRDSENPDAPVGQGYIQPAWHFKGHYSNGNALDVLIQALKQKYLSPNPGQ